MAMKGGLEVEVECIPNVTKLFAVGTPLDIMQINNGLSNHNYVVCTDQGEFVVKFLVTQSPENIENEIAIQQQLLQADVRTLEYLRQPGGGVVYHGHDGMNAVISMKLGGVTPRLMSVQLGEDIGRHLALFHRSVVVCPNRNDKGLMNHEVSGVRADWARQLLHQPLPQGVIHGDLHSGNVLIDPLYPTCVKAILDFEEAGENLYVIDLAATLVGVSSTFDGASIDPELLRAAKRGYETVRTLTDEETKWLPQAFRYANEAWINWFTRYGFDEYARLHQRRYHSFREVVGDRLDI
jgi:Ser/Thr protein kinase RdoA (MazF antagonist)